MTSLAIEHTPVQVLDDPADVSWTVAAEIADFIRRRQSEGRSCVLGLAEYEAIEAFVRWCTISAETTPTLVAKDADEA